MIQTWTHRADMKFTIDLPGNEAMQEGERAAPTRDGPW